MGVWIRVAVLCAWCSIVVLTSVNANARPLVEGGMLVSAEPEVEATKDIAAHRSSRELLGVEGWTIESGSYSGGLHYSLTAWPIDVEKAPTIYQFSLLSGGGFSSTLIWRGETFSIEQSIEQSVMDGPEVSVSFSDSSGFRLVSSTSGATSSSEMKQRLVTQFKANKGKWQAFEQRVTAIVGSIALAPELSGELPSAAFDTPLSVIKVAGSVLSERNAVSDEKLNSYCMIPAAAVGAVAAAVNLNLGGGTASASCGGACAGFAACTALVAVANPSCWGMGSACSLCTQGGIEDYLKDCRDQYIEMF